MVAGIVSALVIGLVSVKAKEREDTVISAIWSVGMAVGIVFIASTPGYSQDLMSYLFGNIMLVSRTELWLIGVLAVLVVGTIITFFNGFLAVCFDDEFARVRGVPVTSYYLLLLIVIACTVVILASVVGIILVIALLTLPAATAGRFTHSLKKMMLLAIIFSLIITCIGLASSYELNLPAGATIIVVAALLYLGTMLMQSLRRLSRSSHRRTA
jgi:zinc transport system permease protein